MDPLAPIVGGALIGLAATALLLFNGRIAGVSGIVGGLVRRRPSEGDTAWRSLFVAGLVSGGLVVRSVQARAFNGPHTPLLVLLLAGLFVGIGSRVAGGCTSGHGVCGLARLSPRSIVATALFMATAVVTSFLLRHLIGI